MHADPGDLIVLQSRLQGDQQRDGEVLEARGPGGTPPFVVRWSDNGHVSLLFPGPDVVVAPARHRPHTLQPHRRRAGSARSARDAA